MVFGRIGRFGDWTKQRTEDIYFRNLSIFIIFGFFRYYIPILKRMKSIIPFYLLFIIAFSIQGQTIVPGGYVSGTWESSQSPYYIQGNIEIHFDSTLIIEPGVDVLFEGSYKLTVHGLLNATGNETDSILFTATNPTTGWQGIEFVQINEDLGISNVRYCRLTHGNKPSGSGGAIYVYQAENLLISNCLIENNYARYGGGIFINDGWIEISHCKITHNNASENAGGIACFNSLPYFGDLEVTYNTSGNAGGIYFENCPYFSYPFFEDLVILHNTGGEVGGLMLVSAPSLVLDGCKISYNQARLVGGIAILNDCLGYWGYPAEKNQVYMNKGGLAYDLYIQGLEAGDHTIINIDTFTVINPDSYLVNPLDKFEFIDGIGYGIMEQSDTDLYISDFGSDTNDGLTPESPLRSFEYALRKITSDSANNNTLWVMPGYYHLTESESATPVYLKNDVKIRATVPGEAILDGDSTCRVLFGYYKNNFTLSGLMIQNGKADCLLAGATGSYVSGGGLYLISSKGTFDSCKFISNYAEWWGGAAYLDEQYNARFKNCEFNQNSADRGGGGLKVYNYFGETDAFFELENCLFSENYAEMGGGGLSCMDDQAFISNCKFIGNTTNGDGAGCSFSEEMPVLTDCLFSKNISEDQGGGIYVLGGTVSKLINCTFSDNQATSGSAIYQILLSKLFSVNSIFWNINVSSSDLIHINNNYNSGWTRFYTDYSDIQGGENSVVLEGTRAELHWQEGNIISDPAFFDPSNEDYSLNWNSPCIEAGQEDTTGLHLPPTDLNGDPRIVNARVDMGGYEFQFPVNIKPPFLSDSRFRIYPMTASHKIKIEFPREFREDQLILKIFSSTGSEVKSFGKNSGSSETEVDVSELSPGLYFLVIMDSQHIIKTGKVIITK
jgi:predicted outer membrane repeat protein